MVCYITQPIAPGAFAFTDLFGNHAYLIVGDTCALLLDACVGLPGLPQVVRGLTELPVRVIVSHGHYDHMGEAGIFDAVYLHEADKRLARLQQWGPVKKRILSGYFASHHDQLVTFYEDNQDEIGQPVDDFIRMLLDQTAKVPAIRHFRSLQDGQVLPLGGKSLQVIHTPGHTRGSVCLWDRQDRILYGGDTAVGETIDLTTPGSCGLTALAESLRRLLQGTQGCTAIYGGHHRIPAAPIILSDYQTLAQNALQNEATIKERGNKRIYVDANGLSIQTKRGRP